MIIQIILANTPDEPKQLRENGSTQSYRLTTQTLQVNDTTENGTIQSYRLTTTTTEPPAEVEEKRLLQVEEKAPAGRRESSCRSKEGEEPPAEVEEKAPAGRRESSWKRRKEPPAK